MKILVCEVCGEEILDEQVAVFSEGNEKTVYTHVLGDKKDCDYVYMMEKMMPSYVSKEEVE